MNQETQVPSNVRFFKLHNGQDLVGYLAKESDNSVIIQRPLVVNIENDFMNARQMLNVREWLPPIITKLDEVELPKELVLLIAEVNDTFAEDFKEVINYFYGVKPKKRERNKSADKVVPFVIFPKDDPKVN